MARYSVPIFLGAFLLFQIEPIMGTFVLPWFGGTPAVWTACMLFFQVLLLCGYAYAHGSASYLKPHAQAAVHVVLLLASLVFLPAIPDASWRPTGPDAAVWRILALLGWTVGLPFLLLSATGPLLQAWYSRAHPGASPYRLYSLSNAASLLALVSYPFLVEPAFALKTQARAWSVGYGLFVLCCGWCVLQLWRAGGTLSPAGPTGVSGVPAGEAAASRYPGPPLTLADSGMCLGLSACGSVMLLSTTSQLSQNIAVVPFLWILPLCLYLLTFVLCFGGARWYWRTLWLAALPAAVAGAYAAPSLNTRMPLALQVGIYCFVLFTGCMLCHGELARLKPGTRHLTRYYLLLAAGGALGGVACSLLAPAVFTGLWEYQYGIVALCVLTLLALVRDTHTRRPLKPALAWTLVLGVAAALGLGFIAQARNDRARAFVTSRNFYGVLRVEKHDGDEGTTHTLVHGRITHGFQYLDGELRRTPVSYYGAESGLGAAEAALLARHRGPLRTGVVGLGAGVMAAYGRAGDAVRFYEINPEIVRLSRQYFTYLSDTPARVDIVLGDARISMEQEQARGEPQQFDLLVLDAFSGDAVPLHLLTREAFALYDYHLKPDGILAVHISSHYLDMAPLIFGLAQDTGRQAALIEDFRPRDPLYATTRWVLVTRDEALLRSPEVAARTAQPPEQADWLHFTDDHLNLFQLLRREAQPRAKESEPRP